jgi:hypothetical protein
MEITSSTDRREVPGALHRWLGAIPLFSTFILMAWAAMNHEHIRSVYVALRVYLPLPTVLALQFTALMNRAYGVWLPLMFAACWLYFGWAAKTRNRLLWFNVFAAAVCIFAAVLLIGGIVLPFLKIQTTLLRK